MAYTQVASGGDFDPAVWERGVELEVSQRFTLSPLMNQKGEPADDSLIQRSDLLTEGPGSTVYFGADVLWDSSSGVKANEDALEGNERNVSPERDSIVIGLAKDAYANDEYMTVQRSSYDVRALGEKKLATLLAQTVERSCFNQLCGVEWVTDTTLSGMQGDSSIVDRTDLHVFAGSATDDEGLTSNDTFTVSLIDEALEVAKTASPMVRPCRIPNFGRPLYVCFIHPYQTRTMKADSGWTNIWQNQIGAMNDPRMNPLISGALGIYNDVLVVESTWVPTGYDTAADAEESDVRRAVLCGGGEFKAGCGRIPGRRGSYKWVEEYRNYGQIRGIAAHMAYGVKRPRFDFDGNGTAEDVNSVVISTYATAA